MGYQEYLRDFFNKFKEGKPGTEENLTSFKDFLEAVGKAKPPRVVTGQVTIDDSGLTQCSIDPRDCIYHYGIRFTFGGLVYQENFGKEGIGNGGGDKPKLSDRCSITALHRFLQVQLRCPDVKIELFGIDGEKLDEEGLAQLEYRRKYPYGGLTPFARG